MNLNDIFKDEQPAFLSTKKLVLEDNEGLNSLEGLDKFIELEELIILTTLELNSDLIKTFESIKSTLKSLTISNNYLPDLSFIDNFNLVYLDLGNCLSGKIDGPSDISSELSKLSKIKETLKELYLSGSSCTTTEFLKDSSLESLDLSDSLSIIDFGIGFENNETLKKSLKKLNLSGNKYVESEGFYSGEYSEGLDDLSFLEGYSLKELNISDCSLGDRTGGSELSKFFKNNSTLKSSLKSINLDETSIDNLFFLEGYKLENLSLSTSFTFTQDKIKDLDKFFLSNFNLKKSLKSLKLSNKNLENLVTFKEYESLQSLNIQKTQVRHLTPLLNSEYFKNGSLQELYISDTALSDKEDYNVLKILKLKGVKVFIDGKPFTYNPSPTSTEKLVEYLVKKLELTLELSEKATQFLLPIALKYENDINNKHIYSESKLGKVAYKVVRIEDYIIKITERSNFEREFSVYIEDDPLFSCLRPGLLLKERIVNDKLGIMLLSNLANIESKFAETLTERKENANFREYKNHQTHENLRAQLIKSSRHSFTRNRDNLVIPLSAYLSQEGSKDIYDFIDHFVYASAMFHNLDPNRLNLLPPRHRDLSGRDYVGVISDYNHLKQYSPLTQVLNQNILQFENLLHEVNDYIEKKACCPIIGDFKKENTVKGHIVDFDRIRFGHPLEDVSRFLEQLDFNLDYSHKEHFVLAYNQHRRSIDSSYLIGDMEALRAYPLFAFHESFRALWANNDWKESVKRGDLAIPIKAYQNILRYAAIISKEKLLD